jgi:site-specific recombinase XerD
LKKNFGERSFVQIIYKKNKMKTFNVMFYLKADKANEMGKAPIYCRLTIDGNRITFSTREWILPERWKLTNRLTNTKSKEEIDIRNELKRVESTLREAKRVLLERQVEISPDAILSQFRGEESNSKTLLELCDYFLKTLKAKVKAGLKSDGTLERYETIKRLLEEFMLSQYKKKDFQLKKLNFEFIEKFDLYMREIRKCGNNTTVKYVRNIRSAINMGIKHDWLTVDPFRHYEGQLEEVKTVYLNDEELAAIETKTFSTERLNVVKHQFLFSCYTSYAPCDVARLMREDVVNHVDGEKWIFIDRQKTHIKSDVLLLPPALEIIEKYRNHPECITTGKLFPSRSNQKLNEYLKEIATLCGINKNLHFYVSRHTFGTTVTLAKGVPIETVSKMMGHKRLTTTQHYAKILNLKVSADMKKLKVIYKARNEDESAEALVV